MIRLDFDDGDLRLLQRRWFPAHRAALRRAVKAESFRLRHELQGLLRRGVPPQRAPLTRRVAGRRGARALRWFAPMIAFEVRDEPQGLTARIGLTAQARRRRKAPEVEFLERALSAGRWVISREDQEALAERLRARGIKRLDRYLPEVGHVARQPARDPVGEIARREVIPHNLRHIAGLYRRAMAGDRWKGRWWETES